MTSDDPRSELPVPNRRAPYRGPAHHAPPLAADTGPVYEPPRARGSRVDRGMRSDLGLIAFLLVAGVVAIGAWTVAGNVADGILHPAATHPGDVALASPPGPAITPPLTGPTPVPSGPPAASSEAPSGDPSAGPSAAPTAAPTRTPRPARKAVDVRIERKPAAVFVSEQEKTWCASAAVQIALNVVGPEVDRSRARQARIHAMLRDATTRHDSRNGGAGPLGMVEVLDRLGDVDYALQVHPSRDAALHAAAAAIRKTGHPAILLAWRGAHAWVMTGFRADADPAVFKNARVTGAYILDPWYPRVSSIWGPSDGPGVFQDRKEMIRNYRPWRRPEGRYPGRDGNFLVIVPRT